MFGPYATTEYSDLMLVDDPEISLTFFAERRPGPELKLENAVMANLGRLFRDSRKPSCVFGSKQLGSGSPDLIIVHCEPRVVALADVNNASLAILAYLRVVQHASIETIADRLRLRPKILNESIRQLAARDIVRLDSGVLNLAVGWHNVLPEVITVEVKVSKWRAALSQASRNRVFSHRSFIALPVSKAQIAAADGTLNQLGIGVIAISPEGAPKILRTSSRTLPRVWRYYYELAAESARHLKDKSNAI